MAATVSTGTFVLLVTIINVVTKKSLVISVTMATNTHTLITEASMVTLVTMVGLHM
jgi:hypothetical protein